MKSYQRVPEQCCFMQHIDGPKPSHLIFGHEHLNMQPMIEIHCHALARQNFQFPFLPTQLWNLVSSISIYLDAQFMYSKPHFKIMDHLPNGVSAHEWVTFCVIHHIMLLLFLAFSLPKQGWKVPNFIASMRMLLTPL